NSGNSENHSSRSEIRSSIPPFWEPEQLSWSERHHVVPGRTPTRASRLQVIEVFSCGFPFIDPFEGFGRSEGLSSLCDVIEQQRSCGSLPGNVIAALRRRDSNSVKRFMSRVFDWLTTRECHMTQQDLLRGLPR